MREVEIDTEVNGISVTIVGRVDKFGVNDYHITHMRVYTNVDEIPSTKISREDDDRITQLLCAEHDRIAYG